MTIFKEKISNLKRKKENFVNAGAQVKEDINIEKAKRVQINLGIPEDLLKKVDESVKNRYGITRSGWVLEAIHEKLQRENNESPT